MKIDWLATLWTIVKVSCPICKQTYSGWYCPSCGLPKKNSKFALSEYGSVENCRNYHFRPEFSSFEDFRLCDKCYTTNPYNSKYCRNCKNKFNPTRGIDKDAHKWVDLGLSVLWSEEIMSDTYQWMSSAYINRNDSRLLEYEGDGKDAATEIWGHKWRTPTKDEFEELFTKCRWERCIDPISKNYTLKATGPNGNSIMLPLKSGSISLWTSTEYAAKFNGERAYAFRFFNDIKIEKTLTAKQKIAAEFQESNISRFKYRSRDTIAIDIYREIIYGREKVDDQQRLKEEGLAIIKQYENTVEYQKKILEAMGDDSQERRDNEKKDKEKLDKLWLSTPINLSFNEDHISDNKQKYMHKRFGLSILPVADKKWKGKL